MIPRVKIDAFKIYIYISIELKYSCTMNEIYGTVSTYDTMSQIQDYNLQPNVSFISLTRPLLFKFRHLSFKLTAVRPGKLYLSLICCQHPRPNRTTPLYNTSSSSASHFERFANLPDMSAMEGPGARLSRKRRCG